MGLSIGIGELVYAKEEDDEEFLAETMERFSLLNQALRANGIPPHHEPADFDIPEPRCIVEGFPYSCLHYLRRFAAYVLDDPPKIPAPVGPDGLMGTDPQVEKMSTPKNHLLFHSDCEGFYVPIDFEDVVTDERVPGETVGSSVRLMEELVTIAPFLGIDLSQGKLSDAEAAILNDQISTPDEGNLYPNEKMAWFALFDAAEQSLAHGSAIVFG